MNARPVHDQSSRGGAGFVLPLALIVIAIMALALWSAAATLESTARALRDEEARAELDLASATLEARIGFLMASEPLGPVGLRIGGRRISREEILGVVRSALTEESLQPVATLRLDGSAYDLPAGVVRNRDAYVLRLQDRSGLFNLNLPDEEATARFLRAFGVERERALDLAAALADYIDEDDLRRLRGAEADIYARRSLPEPLNDRLRSPDQAFGALGWEESLELRQKLRLLEASMVAPRNAPQNVNTANTVVLRGWFALSEEEARQAVALRESAPFGSLAAFGGAIGRVLPEVEFRGYVHPSDTVRLRVERRGSQCLQSEVWIQLAGEGAPQPLYFHQRLVKRCSGSVVEGEHGEERAPFPDGSGVSGL